MSASSSPLRMSWSTPTAEAFVSPRLHWRLTIVGGVREASAAWRRGRLGTVCARGAYRALLCGPSTSPLGRNQPCASTSNLRGLGLASSYLLSGQLRYYSSSRRRRWGCGLIRTRTLSDPAYCLGLHSGRRLLASW